MLTCAVDYQNITPKSMHVSSCIPHGQGENEVMTSPHGLSQRKCTLLR